jgi:hypothetical protein
MNQQELFFEIIKKYDALCKPGESHKILEKIIKRFRGNNTYTYNSYFYE